MHFLVAVGFCAGKHNKKRCPSTKKKEKRKRPIVLGLRERAQRPDSPLDPLFWEEILFVYFFEGPFWTASNHRVRRRGAVKKKQKSDASTNRSDAERRALGLQQREREETGKSPRRQTGHQGLRKRKNKITRRKGNKRRKKKQKTNTNKQHEHGRDGGPTDLPVVLRIAGAAPERMGGPGQGVSLHLLGRRPGRGPRRGPLVANPRRPGSGVCVPRDGSVAPRTRPAGAGHRRQPLVDVARVSLDGPRRRRGLARVGRRRTGDPRARPTLAASTTTARTHAWRNLITLPFGPAKKKRKTHSRLFCYSFVFRNQDGLGVCLPTTMLGRFWRTQVVEATKSALVDLAAKGRGHHRPQRGLWGNAASGTRQPSRVDGAQKDDTSLPNV